MVSITDYDLNLEPSFLSLPVGMSDGLIYIEHFQKTDGCSTPNRPWMVASNPITQASIVFRPTCKTWACPSCADVNRRRWIATALHGVESLKSSGHNVDFLTLTSHERLRGTASFRVWPLAWKKLQARYYYALPDGDPGAYLAVPERHKDGSLHTHATITGGLDERWWKDNARECGMGYMADVQEVNDLGVAGYVSKYLGKTMGEAWPKYKRRVNTSRSWPTLPDLEQQPGWMFRVVSRNREIWQVCENLAALGHSTFLASAEGAWTLIDRLSGLA